MNTYEMNDALNHEIQDACESQTPHMNARQAYDIAFEKISPLFEHVDSADTILGEIPVSPWQMRAFSAPEYALYYASIWLEYDEFEMNADEETVSELAHLFNKALLQGADLECLSESINWLCRDNSRLEAMLIERIPA